MKFIFCVDGHFVLTWVDDRNIQHDSAITIEDEDQTVRLSLGLDRDNKQSKSYDPYYAHSLSREKMIWFRDELTKLIEETEC